MNKIDSSLPNLDIVASVISKLDDKLAAKRDLRFIREILEEVRLIEAGAVRTARDASSLRAKLEEKLAAETDKEKQTTSVKEAAYRFGQNEGTIRSWLRDTKKNIGEKRGGRWVVHAERLRALLEQKR